MRRFRLHPGAPWPVGPALTPGGARFVVYSRHAEALTLVLVGPEGRPEAEFPLDPARHRTGHLWHAEVEGVAPGQLYAFRAAGPAGRPGHRIPSDRLLLDPHARAVVRVGGHLYSALVRSGFDWGDDRPPARPWEETVIYELHVRGFTRHPSARASAPGTYRALAERLPYIRDLGVTAIELLPIHTFDPERLQRRDPVTGAPLRDYWGYSPLGFFAPMGWYAAARTPAGVVDEFKALVRAAHRHGLEIILDVVFNHTGEDGEDGPTWVFRGLDDRTYYLLDEDGRYRDLTGCGNTLRTAHPVVGDLILECLRYFVAEFHVDGFRFDLASVLARDEAGKLGATSPLLERIAADPLLAGRKLIAEPWDGAEAFQVGHFGGPQWADWNPLFRDAARAFWRGDGAPAELGRRLLGSPDRFATKGPLRSIHYVACHDGFTLRDVVSYSRKHNERNGEENRDGLEGEISWNHGVEGPGPATVEARRRREVRCMLATLFVAQGVPMLTAGDECYRTQEGNNNAYCQDNELSWFDWTLVEREAALVSFTRALVRWRRTRRRLLQAACFPGAPGGPRLTWLDAAGRPSPAAPERGDWLALLLEVPEETPPALLVLLARGEGTRPWPLPPPPAGTRWVRRLDVGRPSAPWLWPDGAESPAPDPYPLAAPTVVVLEAVNAA